MTKPDWCPQWAWDRGLEISNDREVLATTIARALLEAERRADERNAETIRRLQDNMSKMAMDWTKTMAGERRAGIAEGMERAARYLEPVDGYFNPPQGFYEALQINTDDDGSGFRVMSGDTGNWSAFIIEVLKPFANAIRAAAKEIEP